MSDREAALLAEHLVAAVKVYAGAVTDGMALNVSLKFEDNLAQSLFVVLIERINGLERRLAKLEMPDLGRG